MVKAPTRHMRHVLCRAALAVALINPPVAQASTDIDHLIFTSQNRNNLCAEAAINAATLINKAEFPEWQVTRAWSRECADSDEWKLYQLAFEPDGSAEAPIDRRLKARLDAARRGDTLPDAFRELLRSKAEAATVTTEDGKIVRAWLMNGYFAYTAELKAARGGKLREWAHEDLIERSDNLAYEMSVSGGTWLPSNNLARLGNQPSIGMLLSLSLMRISIGMKLDFRFGESPGPYAYFNPNSNSLQQTSRVNSLYMGCDLRYDFLRFSAFSLLASLGVGYDNLTHYAATRYSGEKPAMSDSFSIAPGLVIRYHFDEQHTIFADVSFYRHFVGFDVAPGADSLSGGYSTILFAVGMKLLTVD
ncbi:hypothetical protein [Turneriella parva]|nr:hypothetical protein [Turneriella parva]